MHRSRRWPSISADRNFRRERRLRFQVSGSFLWLGVRSFEVEAVAMTFVPNAARTRDSRGAADKRLHARLDGRPTLQSQDGAVARGRVKWLRRCLDALGERPARMLSLGWDHGSANSEFFANLHIRLLTTIDVSAERAISSELRSADGKARYIHVTDYRASESEDLAVTHGVLEEMTPANRTAAALLVYRSLKPGGLFAVWQDNPWAPSVILSPRMTASGERGTVIAARTVRSMLRGVGFDIVHTTSAIFFPDALAWAQPIVPFLAPIPIWRQYMVLARKP